MQKRTCACEKYKLKKANILYTMEYLFIFQGLFNISDKVLVSLDILLEFREFFKKGHPIGNVIRAKLLTLAAKCKKVYKIRLFVHGKEI